MIRKLFIVASALSAFLFTATLILQIRGNMTIGESIGILHVGIQDLPATENPYEFAWWSIFPLLPITVVSILPPLFAATLIAKSLRSWWRAINGLCPTCSYNLTGNTSGICPECGTATNSGFRVRDTNSPCE